MEMLGDSAVVGRLQVFKLVVRGASPKLRGFDDFGVQTIAEGVAAHPARATIADDREVQPAPPVREYVMSKVQTKLKPELDIPGS